MMDHEVITQLRHARAAASRTHIWLNRLLNHGELAAEWELRSLRKRAELLHEDLSDLIDTMNQLERGKDSS